MGGCRPKDAGGEKKKRQANKPAENKDLNRSCYNHYKKYRHQLFFHFSLPSSSFHGRKSKETLNSKP